MEQRPSMRKLIFELTEGARTTWPAKGQLPVAALNVKYALFHLIGITNLCPSSHRSSLSIALAILLIQISTKSPFNYGAFVLNQIKRHIGSPAFRLPNQYPRLICGILDILLPHLDAPSRELMTSSFESIMLQLFSSEAKAIDQLIQRLTARKVEVDEVLQVMKVVLSSSATSSSSQQPA